MSHFECGTSACLLDEEPRGTYPALAPATLVCVEKCPGPVLEVSRTCPQVTGHRKFAPELSAEAVVERLNREKANSDMIAYALALYEKDATTVVIYVVRAEGRKHREAIKVSPAGFVYRDVAFNTLEEAIKHFKVEASKLELINRHPIE